MFHKIAHRITQQFILNKVIDSSQQELYFFGVKLLFTQMLHLIFLFSFAFYMHLLPEAFCYFFVFMAIRSNSGGYHAASESLCFLYTTLTHIAVLLCLFYTSPDVKGAISIAILLFAVPIIWRYAPLDSQKVPLEAIEKRVYRKRSRTALLLSLCAVGLCFAQALSFAYACSVAIFVVALLLLLGRKQN